MQRCALRCGLVSGPGLRSLNAARRRGEERRQVKEKIPERETSIRTAGERLQREAPGRPWRHLLLPFPRVLLPPVSSLQASSVCILSSCYQTLALVVPLQYITIFVRVFSPSTQLSPVAERPTGRLLQLVKLFFFFFYIHPQFVSHKCLSLSC